MVNTKSLLVGLALALSATAFPIEHQTADCKGNMNGSDPKTASAPVASPASSSTITAAQLVAIDPATANCPTPPGDCADAARAAPAISDSFEKYGIKTRGEQAALIAVMLFESDSFKYNKNVSPGRPGQGTRNMQMPKFNKEYAISLNIPGAATIPEDQILTLKPMATDEVSFGSAAWFLKRCDASISKGLQDGSMVGWNNYLTQCIGTTHTPQRDVSWTAAKKVLGV